MYIPRKPNPSGVKALTLCVKLTRSGRSYCVQVVPDVSEPRLDPPTALGMAVRTMRSLGLRSLIADSWFGSVHAVHPYEDIYVTFSVSAPRAADIFPVFHHQLVVPQYRVFAKEGRVVSVFADSAILSVVSTLFEVTTLVHNDNPVISGATLAYAPRLSQISDAPPRFSTAFRDMLLAHQQLPRSDLTSLAMYLGEARGTQKPRCADFLIWTDGSKEDLINRICRIPPPQAPAAAPGPAPAAAGVGSEQESAYLPPKSCLLTPDIAMNEFKQRWSLATNDAIGAELQRRGHGKCARPNILKMSYIHCSGHKASHGGETVQRRRAPA